MEKIQERKSNRSVRVGYACDTLVSSRVKKKSSQAAKPHGLPSCEIILRVENFAHKSWRMSC
jgi:hypothetical protein